MENSAINKINKPIVLLGMMGVGKTTYGKKLASMLKIPFFDIDHEIENEIGHSVSWIFENIGEEEFRHMEENKIRDIITNNKQSVVALGGGAFLNANSRELIGREAISVWLKSSANTILNRVSVRKDRPLLEGYEDKLGRIKEIMEARQQTYSQAHMLIETDNGNPKEIAVKIMAKIEDFLK